MRGASSGACCAFIKQVRYSEVSSAAHGAASPATALQTGARQGGNRVAAAETMDDARIGGSGSASLRVIIHASLWQNGARCPLWHASALFCATACYCRVCRLFDRRWPCCPSVLEDWTLDVGAGACRAYYGVFFYLVSGLVSKTETKHELK